MRIARRENYTSRAAGVQQSLGALAAMATHRWPVCGAGCPSDIAQNCHRNCPDVPVALSDAPEEYPLETVIAPLVYEMRRLDGIYPCWSCEGHERFGDLWKLPQVWFYAKRQIHVRVLSDVLTAANLKGGLDVEWEVVVTYSDSDNPETTYALRPKQNQMDLSLKALQADVQSLAAGVVELCQARAKALQNQGA